MSLLRTLLCALGLHDYHYPHLKEPRVGMENYNEWLWWLIRTNRTECRHCLHEPRASKKMADMIKTYLR
jgi:hypothetical protein